MLWGEIRLCTHRGATKKGLEYKKTVTFLHVVSKLSGVWFFREK